MHFSVGADTNVLFSGIYFAGVASTLVNFVRFKKVDLYQSEYLRDELVEVARRNSLPLKPFEPFYSFDNVHIITDRSYYSKEEFASAGKLVRDKKDVPVYVFAKKMLSLKKIDYFVTGDKDLLEEKVKKSLDWKMISIREFNEIAVT